MSDATGGVPRLVSGPRKKPTKTLSANSNVATPSRCLKNSNGLAPRLLPRDAAGDANSGSLEPNRLLRLGLNS